MKTIEEMKLEILNSTSSEDAVLIRRQLRMAERLVDEALNGTPFNDNAVNKASQRAAKRAIANTKDTFNFGHHQRQKRTEDAMLSAQVDRLKLEHLTKALMEAVFKEDKQSINELCEKLSTHFKQKETLTAYIWEAFNRNPHNPKKKENIQNG